MNGISIGIDGVRSQFDKELNATREELQVAQHFIEIIRNRKPGVPVALERRADNYLSLCSGVNDFLRLKYTDRARWVSIDAEPAGLSADDPRFAAQKNKNQRHWKASLRDLSDLAGFDDAVVAACQYIERY